MAEIEQAEESARNASGFVTREDGTVQSKLVASVSSGSESISYATSSSGAKNSLIGAVLTDKAAQEKLYADTFSEYLSGVLDANGVNLLFMGAYPCVRKR